MKFRWAPSAPDDLWAAHVTPCNRNLVLSKFMKQERGKKSFKVFPPKKVCNYDKLYYWFYETNTFTPAPGLSLPPFLYFESLVASKSEDGSISFSLSSREELLSRKYLCTTQEKIIFRRFGEIADAKGVRKKLIENLRKKASSRLWFMVFDETVKKLIHRQHKYFSASCFRLESWKTC